jgi:2-polyprenyl-3-methyl-5-hydroxy-6-metoxy-1,4-benzoquinol methylase
MTSKVQTPWNHNLHYHGVILRSIPANCRRALDVGCGQGLLARRIASHCGEQRIAFLEGDVVTEAFSANSFDLITAVATLHHLPLRPALERFRDLLKPGGVLAFIGL